MDFALALWGAAATDVTTWSTVLRVSYNVLLVAVGIGALILVHEFGHFIVARLCGVRCEKFYIGFDFWGLKFFSFKWGDTEYGLGICPLGGYVKMLGQEDNPGELRAEMERAKASAEQEKREEWTGVKALKADGLIDEKEAEKLTETSAQGAGDAGGTPPESPDEAEQNVESPTHTLEELNEAIYAPDSFLAKSVPQRLAIICAGVAMNFLFAVVCATAAYMVGVHETAPSVGNVVPGSPAWEAGLETGDRIVSINGEPARVFTDINMAMVGSAGGVKLEIQRPQHGDRTSETVETGILEKTIVPRKRAGDLAPMIGVGSLPLLDFASAKTPIDPDLEKYYPEDLVTSLKKPKMHLTAVGDEIVGSYAEYMDAQLKFFDRPVSMRFISREGGEAVEGLVPAIPMKEIGVRFKTGKITTVLPGSDAEAKGIQPGDTIRGVDGVADFDPLKLPQMILRKVNEGVESVELDLVTAAGVEKTVEVKLRPERIIPNIGFLSMKDPVASTALGLAWEVDPVIEAVYPEASEAAKSLPIGGKVTAVKLLGAQQMLRKNSFSIADKEGVQFLAVGEKIDVPYLFDKMLQVAMPIELTEKEKKAGVPAKAISVRLQVEEASGATKTFDLTPYDSTDWFDTDRGFVLAAEKALVKIDDFGEALSLGTKKMIESSLSVLRFLQSLGTGGISPRALGGPVAIVQMAYMFADSGLGSYLIFLCLIGANLAVINILPIPVLDGGHVVFLLYEGITGRPPNETFQVIVSYMGLALILTLMVWVLALDFSCISRF